MLDSKKLNTTVIFLKLYFYLTQANYLQQNNMHELHHLIWFFIFLNSSGNLCSKYFITMSTMLFSMGLQLAQLLFSTNGATPDRNIQLICNYIIKRPYLCESLKTCSLFIVTPIKSVQGPSSKTHFNCLHAKQSSSTSRISAESDVYDFWNITWKTI